MLLPSNHRKKPEHTSQLLLAALLTCTFNFPFIDGRIISLDSLGLEGKKQKKFLKSPEDKWAKNRVFSVITIKKTSILLSATELELN